MTDRLTDEQLDEIVEDAQRAAVVGGQDFWPLRLIAELREARALIAALKVEGCPSYDKDPSDPWAPRTVCAYCDGPELPTPPGAEPRFDHRDVDGEPCMWVRIEQS